MAVFPVSQVAGYLNEVLGEDPVLRDLWVRGEVGNFTRSAAGHSYFTLREGGAALRCVMFRGGVGAEDLAEGAAVIAHGRVSMYEARGDVQLIADVLRPEGVGELQLKLEELKRRLEAEGLFSPSRKRALPKFPQVVGVVTSATGSVWHDIQNVMSRRYPAVTLLLAPALVQGEEAPRSVAAALDALARRPDVDVVILARGGGSLEDLWAFNEEVVARAIFRSAAPVVSAIGHETDFTIADLVADVRAPTPSAAAELVVPDRAELAGEVAGLLRSLGAAAAASIESAGREVEALRPRLDRAPPDFDLLRLRVDDLVRTASGRVRSAFTVVGERLNGLNARLGSLSPRDTLQRGYAIVQKDGAIVTSPRQLIDGDMIGVMVAEGRFEATVGTGPASRRPRPARGRKSEGGEQPGGQTSMELM